MVAILEARDEMNPLEKEQAKNVFISHNASDGSIVRQLLQNPPTAGQEYTWPDGSKSFFVSESLVYCHVRGYPPIIEGEDGKDRDVLLLEFNQYGQGPVVLEFSYNGLGPRKELKDLFHAKGVPSEQAEDDILALAEWIAERLTDPPKGFLKERIPLLSKIYQVDADDPKQLHHLFWDHFQEPWRVLLVPEEIRRAAFAHIGETCKLAQSMMRTIYEIGSIESGDLRRLNYWMKRSGPIQTLEVVEEAVEPLEGELTTIPRETVLSALDVSELDPFSTEPIKPIPIALLREAAWGVREPITGDIVEQLHQLVKVNHNLLARCESCEAIYLRTEHKGYQRFCSARCGSRARMRKHRTSKSYVDSPQQSVL
jgi:hypothetical protein